MSDPPVLLSLAASLDGFIADDSGGVTWLDDYFSEEMDFAGFMKQVGAFVMGRATFDESPGGGGGWEGVPPCVVLTHRPLDGSPAGVEPWDGDLAELVERLKAESSGVIWLMGGGRAAHSFFEAGLVDEIDLNVVPILLGKGRPLFLSRDGRDSLELVDSQRYQNGCMRLRYRVGRN